MLQLTNGQWSSLFNMFSFGLISMLACTVYTLVAQNHVLAKYRMALVMSSMVTFIAGYHYWRIFNSFEHSSMKMQSQLELLRVHSMRRTVTLTGFLLFLCF